MTLEQAKKLYQAGKINQFFVMRNPENKSSWFLTARDEHKRNFLLVDDKEKVVIYSSLDGVVEAAREIGVKTIQVHI